MDCRLWLEECRELSILYLLGCFAENCVLGEDGFDVGFLRDFEESYSFYLG